MTTLFSIITNIIGMLEKKIYKKNINIVLTILLIDFFVARISINSIG